MPDPHNLTDAVITTASPNRHRWHVLSLLAVAQFMLILDVTVVAIALPTMGIDLGLDREQVTWVVSAYALAFGGLMLLGGIQRRHSAGRCPRAPRPRRWPEPESWEGDLRIVPLSSHLLDLDLAAYRASAQAIHAHSAGRWPPDLGRDEARQLMSVHESEHEDGAAYAYAVLDHEGERELGCVYLRPLQEYLERTGTHVHDSRIDPERTAIVTFWLIDDTDLRPSTAKILRCMRQWVTRWRAADPVYRCLPAEVSTLAAIEAASDLRPIAMTGQELPYLWFVDEQTGSSELSS